MALLAVSVATIFYPIQQRILIATRKSGGLASFLTVALVFVVLIIPIIFLATQIFQESTNLYQYLLSNEGSSAFSNSMDSILVRLRNFVPIPTDSSIDIHYYIKQSLAWLLPRLASFVSDIAYMLVNLFIFLIALFYLLKDGVKLKNMLVRISPLQDIHDEEIFSKLSLAINTVLKGTLVVALIQGCMAALGFYLFGIPSPFLWGAVAAIAAVIPGFGTALVISPAVVYLALSGEISSAVGLFVWGMTAVGLIDNFLGPKIVERGVKIHPFLILLSVLGGLSLFGPLGFIFGPLVLSLFFALSEIYSGIFKEHQKDF